MKILIVCQYYFPEPFRITDIAAELMKRGNTVDILTGTPNYPEGHFYKGYGVFNKRFEVIDGVNVNRVFLFPRGKGKSISLALNYISFAINASLKSFGIHYRKYDVVLVYQLSPVLMAIPGIVASKRAGAPLVLYIADLWPESFTAVSGIKNKIILKALDWIVDWVYRKSSMILVTSRGFIDPIVLRGKSIKELRYVPQYPEDIYHPVIVPIDDPARTEIPKGFNIVFTGNIGFAQGLGVVIDAAAQLAQYKEIKFLIIGDGRARTDLEKEVNSRKLNDNIIFLGRRPMTRIPTYLALSDAALLCLEPKDVFALTLPAKTQSYLACGIPIIGSINGEAAQVIRESGAGLVGPAGDAIALADNVLSLYRSSPQDRKAYADNALQYFEKNFRKDHLISKIEKNLSQAVMYKD